jgi:hypothetical protein
VIYWLVVWKVWNHGILWLSIYWEWKIIPTDQLGLDLLFISSRGSELYIQITVNHPNTFWYHILGNEYSVHLPTIEFYALGFYQLKNGLPMNHKITQFAFWGHSCVHVGRENHQAIRTQILSICSLVESSILSLLVGQIRFNPPLRIICLTKNNFGTQSLTQIDSNNQCHVCQYVPLKPAFTFWYIGKLT